jgi:hypothetical protein
MATAPAAAPFRDLSVTELLELSSLPEADASVWVPTASIRVGDRLRPIDEIWAGALGDLMLREGQRVAIDVCRDPENLGCWLLHGAGGHRLHGAKLREIEKLKVLVWPFDENAAKLREIADNLHRRDLDPYDRAVFIAEAVACYKRANGIDPSKDGRSASASARWQKAIDDEAEDAKATLALVYGWSNAVADQLGVSERTIKRGLMLYRRIEPAQIRRLREARHPIAENASELGNLAKLEPSQQQCAVDLLVDKVKPAKSVGEAMVRFGAKKAPATAPEDKHLSAFIGAFNRMGLAEQKGALHDLSKQKLPAGFRIVIDEKVAEADAPTPAVAIRASVKPEYIVCLDCGDKLTNLATHLRTKHSMAFDAYLLRWKLPVDYLKVAPYSEPDGALLTECGSDLELIVAVVRSWSGKPADKVLAAIKAGGGTHRFAAGTNELKLGGVKVTNTAGGENMIRAWLNKADLKLNPESDDE